jgi:cell division protease FtsH
MTLPDRAGRNAILELHARGKRLGDDVDLDAVASVTPGFSGADLENVINEAGLLTARQRETVITNAMMEEAIERVLLGLGGTKKLMSDDEKRMVAYHEAGHALVSLTLPGLTVPHKVTIVPRGGALGYVWLKDEDEKMIHSRSQLINQMAMGFGGRASEELVIGEPGSGAGADLAQLTHVARRMVCEMGMSEVLGGVSYTDRFYTDTRSGLPGYSEEETKVIGVEVRALVDEAHDRARQVLVEHRAALDRIAEALLEHETLSEKELKAALEAEPVGAA